MGRVTNRYDVYDKRGKLLAHDITVPEFADAYRLNRKNVSIAVSRSRAVDYKYRFVRINDPVINSGNSHSSKVSKAFVEDWKRTMALFHGYDFSKKNGIPLVCEGERR